MKILIHANSPTAHTGYGVQTALLSRRLLAAGHEVAVSCTFGQQATGRIWEGVQLYPSGWDSQGNDIIHNHALHWFGGDPRGGWIIILTDLWTITNPVLKDFNVVGWCPVDHYPAPPAVTAFFERTNARCVAMSHFGQERLKEAGLDPTLIPLSVDTSVFKPTPTVETGGRTVTGRELLGLHKDQFVVGMTAMNKDVNDRKGFNEAFRAFGTFRGDHPDAVLYVHTDPNGMGSGLNLRELATHAGIPAELIHFPATYDLQVGSFTPPLMAAMYTAFDVLLAPSRGEGFGVPLIEAQACGTPVIVTDFSSQTELVGAGWTVRGDLLWDQAQHASYLKADIARLVETLESAYTADREAMVEQAVKFASIFDADLVFQERWVPYLKSLEGEPLELDREPMTTDTDQVAVIVPVMRRPHNVAPLVQSLGATANLYFVCDPGDSAEIAAVQAAGLIPLISERGHTFAQKANHAFEHTTEPWVFLCGDDVRFTPDWLDAPRALSDRFDVIGTNDAADGNGNKTVQAGTHADHMFVRRTYVDRYGASLDGPGVLCHEGYNHFFVDYELVKLAKARRVFTPCLDSIVEHLHPALGKGRSDLVYQLSSDPKTLADKDLFESRLPLIEMQA